MRRLSAVVALFSAGSLLSAQALAEDVDKWEPDDTIREALAVHVTTVGLSQLGGVVTELVPGLIPTDALAIPDVDVIGMGISGAKAGLAVDSVDIVPKAKRPGASLELQAVALLSINSQAEPYDASCWIESGAGWVPPTPVTITAPVDITVVSAQGKATLQVVINANKIELDLGQIHAQGKCSGGFNLLVNGLADVLVDAVVKPQLAPLLNGLTDQLADALDAATIHQELEVLGKTLFVDLEPLQVNSYADSGQVQNGGLELIYSSKFTAAQDPCVADYDPLGSLKTDSPIPSIRDTAPAQIGAYVADDMLNQAAYAAFSGGILCVDVDESLLGGASLPIPVDSSLIPLIAGDGYRAILPTEAKPLLIRTSPKKAPTVRFDGTSPITIELEKFGIDFVTELEYRQARVVGLDLAAEIGADVAFDGTTGVAEVLLEGLEADAFTFEATTDEFVPGTNAKLPDSMKGLLGTILPLALGGLTDSLSFALPSFALAEGAPPLGLTDLTLGAAGEAGDWLLADAGLGEVTYSADGSGSGGCGGCGGGCDGGCGGGCSSGGLGMATWMGVFFPAWILRRRKR